MHVIDCSLGGCGVQYGVDSFFCYNLYFSVWVVFLFGYGFFDYCVVVLEVFTGSITR
jgi:hypothetical protein